MDRFIYDTILYMIINSMKVDTSSKIYYTAHYIDSHFDGV